MNKIKQTINWGIIGCGNVCEVKSGPAFRKVPNSQLVAVMRRDLVKAQDYASRHGVAKFYADAQQLIDDPQVNAIYIATPPSSHEEYALRAIAAGKPAYIEKPLSIDAPSTRRILQASERAGVKVSGAYYRRRLPLFEKVKALITEGCLGNVSLISIRLHLPANTDRIAQTETNWRIDPEVSGGGLFHDLAPHMLDIIYWIFGRPLDCRGRSLNQANLSAAPDFTALDAVFAGGIFLGGTWSFHVHPRSREDSCTIYGERGQLTFSFFETNPLQINTDTRQESLAFRNPEHIQMNMIRDVVRYFRGEGENPCSLEDALVSTELMDAVGKP